LRELDTSITQTAALLGNQIEYEEDKVTFEWEEGMGRNKSLISNGLFQYWSHRAETTTRSPALGSHDLPQFSGMEGKPLLRDITLPDGQRGRAIGLRVYPYVLPEEKSLMEAAGTYIDPKLMPHTLVVAGNAEPLHQTLKSVQQILAIGVVLTLFVGFLMIHLVVRGSLRPIDELAAEMGDRAENKLDAPLEISAKLPSELIPLAKNFDSLLCRVATIRSREMDFIRHASHELRTPVAALRATTDLALSMPRESADYVKHLTRCQKTAVELSELVGRLSALSRMGKSGAPVVLKLIDAGVIITECLGRFEPLFVQLGLTLDYGHTNDSLMVKGDQALLRIVVNNLLDNVCSYAPAGSEVRIRSVWNAGRLEIRFSNETVDTTCDPVRFFEPMFRREMSRHDADAHLGIGLTLARAAATSMDAGLQAKMVEENRIEFILSMSRMQDSA
jgi:signal transduction histidine kinase